MTDNNRYKRRPVLYWAALFCFIFGGMTLGAWQAAVHPNTPLPPEWNPTVPLNVKAPVTGLTQWKLTRALANDDACIAALGIGADIQLKPDFVGDDPRCGIAPQVSLSGAGGASIKPVNTRCQTALRLAMWAEHGLQPVAQDLFGQDLKRIEHFSSYSCRAMRTTSGGTGRMSTHATADAIDISGFMLADGTTLSLLRDWKGTDDKARFLRRANETACQWFRMTLGPEYNSLHADHFHLQNTGFGLCR